jgi:hypothetical protein
MSPRSSLSMVRQHALVIGAIAGVLFATGARCATLDQLSGRQELAVGPLVLSNFVVTNVVGVGPSSIRVEPEAFLNAEGTPLLGVRFAGPIAVGTNLATPKSVGFTIAFDVTLTDDQLALAGLTHATVGAAYGSGAISNATVVSPAGDQASGTDQLTAQRSCLAGRAQPEFPWTSDVSELFAPSTAVHVEQAVEMVAGNRDDAGTANLEHVDVLFWLAPAAR